MSLIETRDLWQRRGERDILKNINIRVERGEVFALIGPTGAGKTTLLRLIDLIDMPTSGKIFFNGADVTVSEKVKLETRRRMAFVLQKPIVFNMSVYDNIAYGLRWRGVGSRQIREKVDSILETVRLTEYKNRNARTLSGGEVQGVAIARAIAIEPEVLLLDEPTANLDPISASRIEELIAGIIKRDAITVIMATHDMSQGQRLADRIGVLVDGEIAQTGGSRDIFTSPKNREVAEFVGMENILDGVIVSNEGELATIDVSSTILEAITDFTAGEEVSVCIRPEDVTLALSKIPSSARNSLAGEVTWVVSTGPLSRVELDCGFPLVVLVTKRSAEELGLKKGRQVYASFKAASIHVIKRH
jgi:tungstate transport system ATP-binding protein